MQNPTLRWFDHLWGHFRSGEELENTLHRYVGLYNQQLPQSALGSKPPLQAMKDWHKVKLKLFRKNPYYLPGYDIYQHGNIQHMSIFENDFLKITLRQTQSHHESNSILLSFTGIGHAMGGLNVQKPEFFGAGRSFDNIIFITDKTRSWGNQLDFDFIKEAISPFVEKRKVYSIGNSMGGFNSIISTNYISTDVCIAFVPQYSVNPSIVPWETRWKGYTSNIKSFRFERVSEYMNNTTNYFIFTGGKGPDRRHAELFPVRDNIHHYSFPSIGHSVASSLKEMDALDKVVQSCLNRANDLPQNLEYDILSPKIT